jgi:hypothetical protein
VKGWSAKASSGLHRADVFPTFVYRGSSQRHQSAAILIWFWLYRSPILVGKRGVFYLFKKDFYLPSLCLAEGGQHRVGFYHQSCHGDGMGAKKVCDHPPEEAKGDG